ncbi:MAG: ECF-type sigma factor [Myxococcota bacterium]
MGEVTQLLEQARQGDSAASERLFTAVYGELKALAGRARRASGPLDTTGLVHECYLRLGGAPDAKNRGHFFALAARAMRQILCDQARRQLAARRGGGDVPSDEVDVAPSPAPEVAELVELDGLFTRLANEVDARAAQVMECRVFGGFTVAETAEALEVSERTVHLDFDRARAWLSQQLAR